MFTPSGARPAVKLAIIRSTSIGDVVLASACIDLLNRLSAPVELYWVGRNPALQLIEKAFPSVKPILVNSDKSNYIDDIVSSLKDVHIIVDLQMSIRSRAICRALNKAHGVRVFTRRKNSLKRGQMVVAARLRGRRSPLPSEYAESELLQHKMMSYALRQALRSYLPVEDLDNIKSYKPKPILPCDHEDETKSWQKELKFGTWLAVAPGASYETKRAPQELFVDVIQRCQLLLDKSGLQAKDVGLLFVGNDDDREIALSIIDKAAWPGPTLNLSGKLSLWESTLAIKECSLVLSNDSSLCHIGEAVGVPSAVLFGPTVEAFGFPPWRNNSQAFSAPLGCRPCSKHGKADCRYGDKLCFKMLPAQDIAQFIFKTLDVVS